MFLNKVFCCNRNIFSLKKRVWDWTAEEMSKNDCLVDKLKRVYIQYNLFMISIPDCIHRHALESARSSMQNYIDALNLSL